MSEAAAPADPSKKTRGVLPHRVGPARRVLSAVGAALDPRSARRTLTGAESNPSAHELTIPRAPSIGERARLSWRSTDYINRLDAATATTGSPAKRARSVTRGSCAPLFIPG